MKSKYKAVSTATLAQQRGDLCNSESFFRYLQNVTVRSHMTRSRRPWGSSTLSLTSVLDDVGGLNLVTAALTQGTWYPLYRRLGRSGRVGKIYPHRILNSKPSSP